MLRKRELYEDKNLYKKHSYINIIDESNGVVIYEIGNEITTDFVEAISIMMYDDRLINNDIWNVIINKSDDYDVEKCLFWLSGGVRTWGSKFYCVRWSDVYQIYVDSYLNCVNDIIGNSKTFGDVKGRFLKELSYLEFINFGIKNKYIQ